jgi:hypothetical protein
MRPLCINREADSADSSSEVQTARPSVDIEARPKVGSRPYRTTASLFDPGSSRTGSEGSCASAAEQLSRMNQAVRTCKFAARRHTLFQNVQAPVPEKSRGTHRARRYAPCIRSRRRRNYSLPNFHKGPGAGAFAFLQCDLFGVDE